MDKGKVINYARKRHVVCGIFYANMRYMNKDDVVQALKEEGGVGVFPTDTLYGIVGSAFSKKAVERIYNIKGRDDNKPFIVLISQISDLATFGINLTADQLTYLDSVWPGPVSVILPCLPDEFAYIHRGTQSIAFRIPNDEAIREFMQKTGPLVAPSANPQGLEPAYTIDEARNYFGDTVDFYIDEGEKRAKPSTIISMLSGEPIVLRK